MPTESSGLLAGSSSQDDGTEKRGAKCCLTRPCGWWPSWCPSWSIPALTSAVILVIASLLVWYFMDARHNPEVDKPLDLSKLSKSSNISCLDHTVGNLFSYLDPRESTLFTGIKMVVVGNGPLSSSDRNYIKHRTNVVRFNSADYFEAGDPVAIHVIRDPTSAQPPDSFPAHLPEWHVAASTKWTQRCVRDLMVVQSKQSGQQDDVPSASPDKVGHAWLAQHKMTVEDVQHLLK